MNQRAREADAFIARAGWRDASRTLVAGDASNRRYDRLIRADGRSAILMDAPPEKGEDVRPFIDIAEFLKANGFSAPEIYHRDEAGGWLLIEDLGDALFARVVVQKPLLEAALYEAATDVLARLVQVAPPILQPYDAQLMTDLAALAFDWYLNGAADASNPGIQVEFRRIFAPLLAPLDDIPHVLIQRDYHAENLLWLPDRDGISRVGLLDFQDAMLGHPAYDLVSVLQDARRDVPPEVERAMMRRFVDATGADHNDFNTAYALLGLQRNLRILGVFARLCIRDGKPHYVDLIPRVWGHIQTNLRNPALTPVRDMIEKTLPAPTPDILEKLKSKCATHPKP